MVACASTPGPGPTSAGAQARVATYLVSLLDDPVVPVQARLQALVELEAAGREALAPLVARWSRPGDAPFAADRRLPPGPLTAEAGPGPTTVKQEVEALLYRIIDPGWPAPEDPRRLAPRGPYVADWAAWWEAHQQDSLQTLRAWALEARAAARRSPAALGAPSAGRLAAPRGPLTPTAADPEAQAAFLELQVGLHDGAPDEACARARALAERHPGLARHAAHLCWRRGVTPE